LVATLSHGVFRKIRELTSERRTHQSCIKDNDVTILTEKELVMDRVKRYEEELNEKPEGKQPLGSLIVKEEKVKPDIMLEEVRLAIRGLITGKSPGIDSIPAELLKATGDQGV